MLRIPGRIPIIIHPTFWLFAAIIGFINSMSFLGTLIWIGIIFVSVLVHEYGHALTAVVFGQKPRIELVAMGGITFHDGQKLPFWKQFFVVLDGPVFGILLFVGATFLLQLPFFSAGMPGAVMKTFQTVNLFWTLLNLLPVLPLDGGQLLRIVLEAIFGGRGFRYSLLAGVIVATLLSLFFFVYQAFLIGAIFFLLAYQSYDAWKKSRTFAEADRSDSIKSLFEKAEEDLQAGRKEQALAAFEKIHKEAKQGMIDTLATQYLALLKYDQGKTREAYELLRSIKSDLAPDAQCLLHRAAFEEKDYALVNEMGGPCFQTTPTSEVALRNAIACAHLSQPRPAVGWLQTALQEGLDNFPEILKDRSFDSIRNDPHFQALIKDK